jgi:hypothetical protein
MGPCKDELFRAIFSGATFFLFFTTAYEVGRSASIKDWLSLESAAVWVLLIGFASIILELLIPQLFPGTAGYRSLGKFSGMFNEPSYLAMAMAPSLILLMLSNTKKNMQIGIVSLVILYAFSRSSTLIGILMVQIIYKSIFFWPWPIIFKAILATMVVLIAFMMIDYENLIVPFLERLTGVFMGIDSSDVSSLVYSAGIQDSVSNFLQTYGVGTGFNTMGCDPLPSNPVRDLMMSRMEGMELLNTRDGSFLLSKIVSEFGILGVVLFGIFCVRFRRFEALISRMTTPEKIIAGKVLSSLLLSFIAIAIVRSTGYFNGSVFLGILALGGTFGPRFREAKIVQNGN